MIRAISWLAGGITTTVVCLGVAFLVLDNAGPHATLILALAVVWLALVFTSWTHAKGKR